MQKRYYIKVDGNDVELKRILMLLFTKGYVFDVNYRINTLDAMYKRFNNDLSSFNYLTIGFDFECKMVISSRMFKPLYVFKTTVEELLDLK